MAIKETTQKTATKTTKTVTKAPKAAVAKPVAKKVAEEGRYVYAVGRRKSAVAQVRIYPAKLKELEMTINGQPTEKYFGTSLLRDTVIAPLRAVGLENDFRITVVVMGGGTTGQADAIKLGVARALLKHDELLKAVLRANGFLTRDARAVERKKPGLKKARRAPQWSKR